jgi:hypothetical protein
MTKVLRAQLKSGEIVGTHVKVPFEGVTLITVRKIRLPP